MKKLSLLLSIMLLSGCAAMHYGNFTQIPQGKDVHLAEDAASQLMRVYSPAHHTFYINQKIKDGFGINLIHDMRQKGYGIIENASRKKANFSYVLDELEPDHLYRVSLYVGPQILSRVYTEANEELIPISSWSYKE